MHADLPDCLDVLVCPDTRGPLRADSDGSLVSSSGRRFAIRDGIVHLLPERIENLGAKDAERDGWQKVFEQNRWDTDADAILALPGGPDDRFWCEDVYGQRSSEASITIVRR